MLDFDLIKVDFFIQTDAILFDLICTSCFDGNELSEHGDEYQKESRACKIKSRFNQSVFEWC